MSAEYIFKESQKEFNAFYKCSHSNIYKITLPTINKINGIDVKCVLVINKNSSNLKNKYFISLQFQSEKILYCCPESKYILYCHEEKLQPYTSNKINEFLLKIKNDILPNLKLDKKYGKFIFVNNDGKKTIQATNIGEDIFGFEYANYNECAVCYVHTYTHTGCGHSLCIECWNNIKNDLCPICRNELIMHNDELSNCDEDEDDEDIRYNVNVEYDEDEDDDDDDDNDDDDK